MTDCAREKRNADPMSLDATNALRSMAPCTKARETLVRRSAPDDEQSATYSLIRGREKVVENVGAAEDRMPSHLRKKQFQTTTTTGDERIIGDEVGCSADERPTGTRLHLRGHRERADGTRAQRACIECGAPLICFSGIVGMQRHGKRCPNSVWSHAKFL